MRAAALGDLPRRGKQVHAGVLLGNVPDFVFWIGAAALSGSVLVGINPTRRGSHLAHDIRHTECDVIVTEDRRAGLLEGIDHGVQPECVFNVDTDSYAELLRQYAGAGLPLVEPDPGDTQLLLYSSGSTGAPKAVICSQGRLGSLAVALAERTELTADSVSYLCMPLFHGNAIMLNLAPSMYMGSTVVLVREFSASGFVRDLHQHGVTYVNYVGRALSYILAVPEDPRDRVSTLRLAVGTEASPADVRRFSERFGCRVSEGYGSSEGVFRLNRTPQAPEDSLGLPVGDVDLRVLDQDGNECPRAQFDEHGRLLNADKAIGEMVAIGRASAFEGYYKNAEAQTQRVRGDDFWSGDLAYRDEAGYFYFAGRSSDWLRVDSENFSAAPIERILERWSPVAIALVYAVPDPRTGDQVMCALRLVPHAEFDPAAFAEFLDRQPDLGTKWRPRFVRIVRDIPTTGNNKVDRTALRREAWMTDDPVYWRAGAEREYRPFELAHREQLAAAFAEYGREGLIPSGLDLHRD